MCRASIKSAVVILLAACSAGPQDTSLRTVRDSSGVAIVHNLGSEWGDEHAWNVSQSSVVDIGADPGEPGHTLFRVSDARRLTDGRLVVAHDNHSLSFYDTSGVRQLDVGGAGEGPGEFQRLRRLFILTGDTILAEDQRLRRLSRFDASGRFLGLVDLTETGVEGAELLTAHASTLVLQGPGRRPMPDPGHVRDSMAWYQWSGEGGAAQPRGVFAGSEVLVVEGERGPSFELPLFGRDYAFGIDDDGIWRADTEDYELRRVDADGELTLIVRREYVPMQVTTPAVDMRIAQLVHSVTDSTARQYLTDRMRTLPTHATLPAFGFGGPWHGTLASRPVLVDPDGYVWVQETTVPGGPLEWAVFSPDGIWLGQVPMPEALVVTEIGTDYIVGVRRDEDDVEHVQLFALSRSRDD